MLCNQIKGYLSGSGFARLSIIPGFGVSEHRLPWLVEGKDSMSSSMLSSKQIITSIVAMPTQVTFGSVDSSKNPAW